MATHPQLYQLRNQLEEIFDAISSYQPSASKPPILDSSLYIRPHTNEDTQWLQQDNVHGLKKLRDSVKFDLDGLDKFLNDPKSANLPPLSTNAPYLIAVWNEVLCASGRVDAVFRMMPLDGPSAEQRQRGTAGNSRPQTAKVDVVSNNGKRWVRVNTTKNSRMLAEFREIDSYLTDSDDSSWEESDDPRPTLAQTEFDNSLLKMGRSLLAAAKANPLEGTGETPAVTMRLTRLDPSPSSMGGETTDPRIGKTIKLLEEMGVNVELGERQPGEFPVPIPKKSSESRPPILLKPTININLDLSVLIAIISDLSHAPLPKSVDEAKRRFIPPPEYQEWKKQKKVLNNAKNQYEHRVEEDESDEDGIPNDFVKHSRALTNQLLQEMNKGMIQEIHDQITRLTSESGGPAEVRFWATPEARDRCLRIISKIGGASEKRRAHALFWKVSTLLAEKLTERLTKEAAEELYWKKSRYPTRFIPLFPINLCPSFTIPHVDLIPEVNVARPFPPFFHSLSKTCKDILEQETMPHPRSLRGQNHDPGEIQRAVVTKANPRLTAHTVQSLLWGAELGWTTLTANKTSIRAILREIRLARITGRLDGVVTEEVEGDCRAAIWVFDPRSLAEGMCSQSRD